MLRRNLGVPFIVTLMLVGTVSYFYPEPLRMLSDSPIVWGREYSIFELAPKLRLSEPLHPNVMIQTPPLPYFSDIESLGVIEGYVTDLWWVGMPWMKMTEGGRRGGVAWELNVATSSGKYYSMGEFGFEFLVGRCEHWWDVPPNALIDPGRKFCQSATGVQQIVKPDWWPRTVWEKK